MQLARKATGGAEHVVSRPACVIDDPDHLRVGQGAIGRHPLAQPVHVLVPPRPLAASPGRPGFAGGPAGEPGGEFLGHCQRIPHDRTGVVLDRVESSSVDGDDLHVVPEQRPRGGGEVLQPGAHGDDDIGLAGQDVGRGCPDNAERAAVQWMLMPHHRAAGRRLHHRDAVLLGQGDPGRPRSGVAHAPTEHQQRPAGRAQDVNGIGESPRIWPGSRHPVQPEREHRGREVVLLDLHVLGKRENDRPGIGGIGQDPGHLRQRGQQLLGLGDPVEIP